MPTEDTATTDVRGIAGLMFWVGVVGLIPPVTPAGVVLMVIGGIVWLLAPATEPKRVEMVKEVERGESGCMPALATVGLIILILALAGLAAGGVGITMIEGGGL